MTVKEILKGVKTLRIVGDDKACLRGISFDSRDTHKGYLFVAVKGYAHKGTDFVSDAVALGATAVLHDDRGYEAPKGVTSILVEDSREALSRLSANFYGHPTKKMKVVGVTGTNGKTTVTYLLESIFKAAGLEPAVTGTISYRYRGEIFKAERTTPEAEVLQRFLCRAGESGIGHAVMEASSHALSLQRLEDIHFDACIYTNLSGEHLDFHGNMEAYKTAKDGLFERVLVNSCKERKFAVLNYDDPCSRDINLPEGIKRVGFGSSNDADVRILQADFSEDITRARIELFGSVLDVRSHLVGNFNLSNIAASAAAAACLGIKTQAIKSGIEELIFVPGRLERVPNKRGANIFIDYAHTDGALQNVLETLSAIKKGRIVTVFGCGGNRDREKRPRMGKVAVSMSDITVITSDNPRKEDPDSIIEDIVRGIDAESVDMTRRPESDFKKGKKYCLVDADRRQAIKTALGLLSKGDILLIAGKGHEEYQEFREEKIFFSDRKFVEETLERGC